MNIDNRAMVHPKAKIGEGVVIGPYAIVEENVVIGDNTKVGAFAQILGNTQIGKNCDIFSYAVVGSPPQDLKYKGEKSFLIIGDNNVIREFVTMNPGNGEGKKTIIGHDNLFMAYSHIAHDCLVGDGNVFANNATLAGHVEVENRVVLGGLSAVHQFCRVGSFSMIGGMSKAVQDISPYSMSDGHPAKICGLNLIGLKRGNITKSSVDNLKKAFKILFFDNHPTDVACDLIDKELEKSDELKYLMNFVSSSKRGIAK